MCGIGGIRRFGDYPITGEQITQLLISLQPRGADATGVGVENSDGISLLKEDVPACKFVMSREYEDFLAEALNDTTTAVIVHTRAATKGDPRKSENNHPLFVDTCMVVHNGIIGNDDFLFNDLKLERKAETDTDILRAILDKEGFDKKALRLMARCSGSAAMAALHKDFPGYLLLVRSGNPLVLAADEDFLVWASEKHCIYQAMRTWVKRFNIDFQAPSRRFCYQTMADDSAWLIGPLGLEWHDECRISGGSYSYYGRRVFNRVDSKDSTCNWRPIFNEIMPKAEEICPACGGKITFTKEKRKIPLIRFKCPIKGCGKNMLTGKEMS